MTFTTNEIVDLTGLSHRQCQWYDERRIISPAHEGHRRIYDRDQALLMLILAALRKKGLSLQRCRLLIKTVAKSMSKEPLTKDDVILLTHQAYVTTEFRAWRRIEESNKPAYIVSVAPLILKIEEMEKPPARREGGTHAVIQRYGARA